MSSAVCWPVAAGTRVTRLRPAVDHIFVNPALSPTHLNVHRTPLARLASDHFPLGSLLAVAGELTLKLKNE